jgi:soluble lytic murein transglycosylase-like protein
MSSPYDEEYLDEWIDPEGEYEDWDDFEEQATPSYAFTGVGLPDMSLPLLAVLFVSSILFLVLSRITTTSASAPPAAEADSVSADTAGMGTLAPLFTPQVQAWSPQIGEWAEVRQLDPNLIATVMQIESCGDPQAVSSSGAMGLFQVMPFHFAGGEDGYDPEVNARRGLAYLQSALDARGGEIRLAFAGYNAGINGARRPESIWPAETARYVYWGMGIYGDARQGKDQSQYLDEWLASGGAGLCDQAGQRLGLNP